jgi:hypothetical protein
MMVVILSRNNMMSVMCRQLGPDVFSFLSFGANMMGIISRGGHNAQRGRQRYHDMAPTSET